MQKKASKQEGAKFYKLGGEIVTLNKETGDFERAPALIDRDTRDSAREIDSVESVRLPVLRKSGAVELLEPGYDEESKTYTKDAVKFDDSMSAGDGAAFLLEILKEVPFAVEGAMGATRTKGAALAVQLGVYCRKLFSPGMRRPAFVYNTWRARPDAESGGDAEILQLLALSPVCDEPDVEKVAPETGARGFHTIARDGFHLLSSGERLAIGEDRWGSNLVIDIYAPWVAAAPVRDVEVTAEWLRSDAGRSALLAALWAVVRGWQDAGQPRSPHDVVTTAQKFADVVGGIIYVLEPTLEPFARRLYDMGSYDMLQAMRMAFKGVAPADGVSSVDYDMRGLCSELRPLGMLGIISGDCVGLPGTVNHHPPVLFTNAGRDYQFHRKTPARDKFSISVVEKDGVLTA